MKGVEWMFAHRQKEKTGTVVCKYRFSHRVVTLIVFIGIGCLPGLGAHGASCGDNALYQITLLYNMGLPYYVVQHALPAKGRDRNMLDLRHAAQQLGIPMQGMWMTYDSGMYFSIISR